MASGLPRLAVDIDEHPSQAYEVPRSWLRAISVGALAALLACVGLAWIAGFNKKVLEPTDFRHFLSTSGHLPMMHPAVRHTVNLKLSNRPGQHPRPLRSVTPIMQEKEKSLSSPPCHSPDTSAAQSNILPATRIPLLRYIRGSMGICASRNDPEAIGSYFRDKVVWITGASGGLGEALCVELCRVCKPKGLILSARRSEELERVKARCLELRSDIKVAVLPLDLSSLGLLPQKAQEALSLFGEIGVLVNNGGVGFRGVASETTLEQDIQVMNVDYFSGVALTKALLPSWQTAGQGHIVQIASVQGFFGLPGRTAYSAAKHAAVGFYDSLRAEMADTGVSVTVVCPGYIKTGHSINAVRGSGGGYPEGHTSKGVPPEQMALETLTAVARKQPELVSAALDARMARLARALCPQLVFWIMQKRARKERKERLTGEPSHALKGDKAE